MDPFQIGASMFHYGASIWWESSLVGNRVIDLLRFDYTLGGNKGVKGQTKDAFQPLQIPKGHLTSKEHLTPVHPTPVHPTPAHPTPVPPLPTPPLSTSALKAASHSETFFNGIPRTRITSPLQIDILLSLGKVTYKQTHLGSTQGICKFVKAPDRSIWAIDGSLEGFYTFIHQSRGHSSIQSVFAKEGGIHQNRRLS